MESTPDVFTASSPYGGPLEAEETQDGLEIGIGEGYDEYGYIIMSWEDVERFKVWLTTLTNQVSTLTQNQKEESNES